jgi:hypothetical protein
VEHPEQQYFAEVIVKCMPEFGIPYCWDILCVLVELIYEKWVAICLEIACWNHMGADAKPLQESQA